VSCTLPVCETLGISTANPTPSDVSADEWPSVDPYLTLKAEEAPPRVHALREAFNGLLWLVRAGAPWSLMPNDPPPWGAVYQQTWRWLHAGDFEAIVHDLRDILRLAEGCPEQPSAAVLDSRTLQSTPENGPRAGYAGAERKGGSKVPMAVDTLGHLLALHVTAANEQERAQVAQMAATVQDVTGDAVAIAFVDQGYTGDQPAEDAAAHGMRLEVVPPEAKHGFGPVPRRWVAERAFGWLGHLRCLVGCYERLITVYAGFFHLACALLTSRKVLK